MDAYPVKRRFELLATNVAMTLFFRPSDWPLEPSAMNDRLRLKLNLLLFLLVSTAVSLVIDWVVHLILRGRGEVREATPAAICRHPYWIGSLAAIVVCLTVRALASDLDMSPDKLEMAATEVRVCVAGLVVLACWPVVWSRARSWVRNRIVLTPSATD